MQRIINILNKVFERKNVCKEVTNDTLEEELYKYCLLFGLEGYKNYNKTAKILNIKEEYLRVIISRNKNKIGNILSVNISKRKENLLSLKQIKIISDILNTHVTS